MALIINLILSVIIIYLFWSDKLRHKRKLLGAVFVIVFCITLIIDLKNDFKVNYLFTNTPCKVISKNIETTQFSFLQLYEPTFQVEYSVEGERTSQWARFNITEMGSFSSQSASDISNTYDIGETYSCWYNPNNPDTIVIQPGWFTVVDSWIITLIGVVILLFMLI